MTNSHLRALLFGTGAKAPAHHLGVLIKHVQRSSCAEAAGVRAGDLLMAIDGLEVSEEGEVRFREGERVQFEYLITGKKVGDPVRLSLLRGEHSPKPPTRAFNLNQLVSVPPASPYSPPQPLELTVALAPTHELVPRELHKDYHAEYSLIGGLVFVIAGLPLLEQVSQPVSRQASETVRRAHPEPSLTSSVAPRSSHLAPRYLVPRTSVPRTSYLVPQCLYLT